MKTLIALSLTAAILVASPGCYTFNHKVGTGGTTGQVQQESAWFVLWGIIPLTNPDSQAMAGGASDYTVTTRFEPLDVLISFFTGIATIHKQTVTVKK